MELWQVLLLLVTGAIILAIGAILGGSLAIAGVEKDKKIKEEHNGE